MGRGGGGGGKTVMVSDGEAAWRRQGCEAAEGSDGRERASLGTLLASL